MTNHANVGTSASRKDDHVRLATEQADRRHRTNDFDDVSFLHHSLRAQDVDRVTLDTEVFGHTWTSPIFINAMTGGSTGTGAINAALARVAAATDTAIASGSMSHLLKEPRSADTFRVLRTENPHGFVFANLSANASVDDAQRVIDAVEADALQIHVNSAQEVIMPEGDRIFSHWSERIAALCDRITVPIVVKEVGFGMSAETVRELSALGVQAVDVSGKGGTNFAAIENSRRINDDFAELLTWGQSTVNSLLDVQQAAAETGMTVLASGGVRGPLDVAKSLSLGGRAIGIAGGFLHVLQKEGENALIENINRWKEQLRAIQALTGATRPADLQRVSLLITGSVNEFATLRGIPVTNYARRDA